MSNNKVFIIAEVGINHNGNFDLAIKMIQEAKNSGADAVKFQTFKVEAVLLNPQKIDYAWELSYEQTRKLKKYADKIGIEFISSPFDPDSCTFLHKIGVKRIKIPSGELVNPFMLEAAANTKLPLIISTGMATIDEVKLTVNYLKKLGSTDISILHCTTQYPTQLANCNILAIRHLQREIKLPIGFSDHTEGINVAISAVTLGAKIIEKHFTTDKNLPGPDQKTSLEPDTFRALVNNIRDTEISLGTGEKIPFQCELEIAKTVRKVIVAKKNINKGEIISMEILAAKRPKSLFSDIDIEIDKLVKAEDVSMLIGKKINKNLLKNEFIKQSDLII